MNPEIGISEDHLKKGIKALPTLLADEMLLYIKTRKFYWNVAGPSSMEIHKLFQAQYAELEKIADSVAERISKLGGKAVGTIDEFINLTRLEESPDKYPH